jgi:hypothetical protein
MRLRAAFISSTWLLLCGGCGIVDAFSESLQHDRETLVRVHSTHHGTPQGGIFPDAGDPGEARTFTTDEGWVVTLDEAFVVTRSVAVIGCDDRVYPITAYWGALPESFNDADLDNSTFGDLEAATGRYCAVEVTYGPWDGDGEGATARTMPDDPDELQGMTTCARGHAAREDEVVSFALRADDEIRVRVDLDPPLDVRGDEAFPAEITVSKTYDRAFDAIDFTTATSEDLAANMVAVLQLETRASVGARVDPG